MNKRFILTACIIGALLSILVSCNKQTQYVDIYDVVKMAFLTDQGYTGEISKLMTQDVFDKTNIYNAYPIHKTGNMKSIAVDFSLKEVSQTKVNDIVYVNMIYSVWINGVGGSKDVPITFTVQKRDSGWYIIKKEEPA